ncbi:MAG: hypothetical protein K6T72_08610, partial [Anoxybacillus sp.]
HPFSSPLSFLSHFVLVPLIITNVHAYRFQNYSIVVSGARSLSDLDCSLSMFRMPQDDDRASNIFYS